MSHRSLSSEFPNDNAQISAGAIWICPDLTGPATLEPTPRESAPTQPSALPVENPAPVASPSDVGASAEPNTPPDAPALARFEAALVSALMTRGASRSAALVLRMLRLEALPPEALNKDVLLTLQSRGYLDGQARYSQKYRDLCCAWTAVLRGSSQNFAPCGTTTLDRFGADLLAALLAVPATRADELRRELRNSGIAAFGVLQAA